MDATDITASLSDRELEVFLLLGEAVGTAEIARRLRVSVSSVESYRAAIKRKLGLTSSMELIRAAVEHGLLHRKQPATSDGYDYPQGGGTRLPSGIRDADLV